MRYVIYARCSTDDQATGDYTTIDAQRALLTAHVSTRGELVGEYVDEGRSGTNLKRPGFTQMLRDAKAKRFDAVLCSYMSRLGRGDACTVAEYLLREAGVIVEYVMDQFGTDFAGVAGKHVTRLVDAMYVEQVRQWTKTKMEQMVREGYFCGGTVPFGLRSVPTSDTPDAPRRLHPDEESAPVVRTAFETFLESGTIAAASTFLTSATGRHWTSCKTRRLLSNERYVGVLQFGAWRNDAALEPVVAREVFDDAQRQLRSLVPGTRKARSTDYTFYLQGKLWCPHCGCPYTQAIYPGHTTQVPYYICQAQNRRTHTCAVKRINANALHAAVLGQVERLASHWTVMARVVSESNEWGGPPEHLTAQRGQLAQQFGRTKGRETNLLRAIEEGKATNMLLPALERLEAEQQELQDAIARLDRQIAASTLKRPAIEDLQRNWKNIVNLWPFATEDERTELMQGLVERVDVRAKSTVSLTMLADPCSEFASTNQMGAATECDANLVRVHLVSVDVPRVRRAA